MDHGCDDHYTKSSQQISSLFVKYKRNTAHRPLSQVNIYQKPDTRKSLFATPPLYLHPCLLMFGLNMWSQCRESTHTEGPVYIYWAACSGFGLFHGSTRCATVCCHCRARWPQTWLVLSSLSSLLFASCSTSAPAVHLAAGKRCHPVSLEVTIRTILKWNACLRCSSDPLPLGLAWRSSCRRWGEVPAWEVVAGGELTEGDAGVADRYYLINGVQRQRRGINYS